MDLLIAFVVAIAFNLVMFGFAFSLRTDMLTDLSYAFTFVLVVLLALAAQPSRPALVLALAIIVWALRLGVFLFARILRSGRDRRFDEIRGSLFGFLGFWLLQGFAAWLLLVPLLLLDGSAVFWPALIVWAGGLLIESIADAQKSRFVRARPGRFIDTGLWRYSRHPNYFGEILCWAGVFLFVLPSLTVPEALFASLGPIFITLMLLFVTGIPPLERRADERWGADPDYASYKRSTSMLVPWFKPR